MKNIPSQSHPQKLILINIVVYSFWHFIHAQIFLDTNGIFGYNLIFLTC